MDFHDMLFKAMWTPEALQAKRLELMEQLKMLQSRRRLLDQRGVPAGNIHRRLLNKRGREVLLLARLFREDTSRLNP